LIAVLTEFPRLYYLLARELKRRRIAFRSLTFRESIPPQVRVVLTSRDEAERVSFPCVVEVSEDSVGTAVERAHLLAKGQRCSYGELVVGIDPGDKPGMAVLAGSRVVHASRLNSPEDVVRGLREVLRLYTCGRLLIRVGDGGGIYGQRLIRALQENFCFEIELVDEHATTPSVGSSSPELRDVIAAVNIAMKRGRVLKRRLEVSPTMGEIKNIQRESRQMSGNITISRELACRVARGELSLERAIEIQRRQSRE